MMDLWVIRTLVKTKKFWAYIRKNGTNLSRYLSYIQIVNNMNNFLNYTIFKTN
ncbi:hypothetical protein H8356DRAFT_941422 [Neocallimastix lanati (nom. inval.)]|nr:hypothetical protein H8356DRAFT_941422 [Neocallimastix sp. JGI-2020a]